MLEQLRQQVLQTALRMVADGLSHGSAGNISALDQESGLIAVTPTAIEYSQMSADDIVIIDKQGQVVEGCWKPTSEVRMHTIFYRQRPDVGAVVHTHAPYATIFAITHQSIPMVLAESAPYLGAPVQIAPYARPGTEELARVVSQTIGQGAAILLANHGLLTVGADLSQAYLASHAAELTARFVYMARAMGSTPIELQTSEVLALRELILNSYHPTPL